MAGSYFSPTCPAATAHGGINAQDKAQVVLVIAPYAGASVGDLIEVFWNGASIGGATLESSAALVRTLSFTVPAALIVEPSATACYTVTDLSGNHGVSDAATFLVDLTPPGGPDPDPSTSVHEALSAPQLPASTDDGIDASEALAGIPVQISAYVGMAEGDVITLRWGNQSLVRTVAAADVGQTLAFTVPGTLIAAAGENAALPVFYTIGDRVQNVSISPAVIRAVSTGTPGILPAPVIVGYTETIDLAVLGFEDVEVQVPVYAGMSAGDRIVLTWDGRGGDGLLVPVLLDHDVDGVAPVSFTIPNASVTAVADGWADVSYVVERVDTSTARSAHTTVSVTGESASGLAAPIVLEAVRGVLTLSEIEAAATLRIPVYPGMQVGDAIVYQWRQPQNNVNSNDPPYVVTADDISMGRLPDFAIPEDFIALAVNDEASVFYTVRANNGVSRSSPSTVVRIVAGASGAQQIYSLTSERPTVPADGTTEAKLSALVLDAQGDPVEGVTVHWSSTLAGSVVAPVSSQSDANGEARASLSSTAIGTTTITASIEGSSKTLSLGCVAVTPGTIQLSVTHDAPADGVTPNTAAILLKNAAGLPWAGQNVIVSVPSGGTAVLPAQAGVYPFDAFSGLVVTDANGSARFGVTDTQAETVQVSATLAANLSVTTAAPMRFASFVAQPLIGLTVTSGAAANGAAYNNVTVLLTEAGFALGGEAVRVTVDGEAQLSVPASGGGGGQSLTVVTNAAGLATLEVRDMAAETVTVSAELIRMPEVAASSQMTFIVAHARLSLNLGSGAVADGEASNVGTIVLSDAAGEPWPQQTVLVTSEGSSTVTWAPAVTREASRRDAGRREAGRRDAGRRDAGRQEGDRREPGRRVDSRRVDGWGEAARVEGVHPARAGANDRGLAAVVTDGSGRARIELRDTVPETVVVTAVLADEASVIDTQTTSFVAQARDVTVTELIVEPERIPADGVSAALLTATVMQTGSELPAEHALVNWSVVAGEGTLDVLHALSDANGHARTTFTSETPGEALVRATANQTSQSRAVQVTVKQQLTLELASGAAAGGVQGNAGVITLTDLAGRPWADEAVLVTPTGSAIAVWQNRSSRAYISVWTDSEGRAQIEVTDTVAETVTVTVEVKSDPSITDAKTAIFVGDIGDAGVVELSVAPSRIPADGATPATFIATVEDTGTGQVVPKVRVDWTIESGEGVLGATSSTSNASGQAITTLTSETEGTVVVAASANGTRRSQSIDVRGVELSVTLGTGAVADGVASNAGTITLTGLSGDAWQGQSVIVTVDGGASLGLAEDWAGGGAREARGSGARRRPSKARTGTAARMRVGAADTASSRTGAAQPGAAKAGTGTADVVPGQEGRRQPPRVVTLAANALVAPTDAEGQVHIDITDAVAETVTVTATLSSDPDVTTSGTTAFIEVSEAGVVTALEVTPGSIPADGTTYATLTATVTNGGQAVPQVSVAWSILSGSGQLSTTSSTSNVLGRATVTLTSTAPGTVTVEASANGTSQTRSVEVTSKKLLLNVASGAAADGVSGNAGTLVLLDANGAPWPGQAVRVGASAGATITAQGDTSATVIVDTDSTGKASFEVRDTEAETVGIVAVLVDEVSVNAAATTTFVDNAPTFVVFGGRYQLTAGSRASVQARLVALEKTQRSVVIAQWQYEGQGEVVSATAFIDRQPYQRLLVTWNGATRVLQPSNLIGSGQDYDAGRSQAFAARLDDGHLVSWGVPSVGGEIPSTLLTFDDVVGLCSSRGAFAALRSNGTVVAWGDKADGAAIPNDIALLHDIVELRSTDRAFAARRKNGGVVAWGDGPQGGQVSSEVKPLTDTVSLSASDRAFAALRSNRSVVAWGDASHGGSVPGEIARLSDIVEVCASSRAFAVRRANGTVVVWGDPTAGGEITANIVSLSDIVQLCGSPFAFAALRSNGSVIAWGSANDGGNVPALVATLTDVVALWSNLRSFAALRANGSVVTWGTTANDVPGPIAGLHDIVAVNSTAFAYAALRADGSVVAWGRPDSGGTIPGNLVGQLLDVQGIYAGYDVFAALTHDDKVVTWGYAAGGGDSSKVAAQLNGHISYDAP